MLQRSVLLWPRVLRPAEAAALCQPPRLQGSRLRQLLLPPQGQLDGGEHLLQRGPQPAATATTDNHTSAAVQRARWKLKRDRGYFLRRPAGAAPPSQKVKWLGSKQWSSESIRQPRWFWESQVIFYKAAVFIEVTFVNTVGKSWGCGCDQMRRKEASKHIKRFTDYDVQISKDCLDQKFKKEKEISNIQDQHNFDFLPPLNINDCASIKAVKISSNFLVAFPSGNTYQFHVVLIII